MSAQELTRRLNSARSPAQPAAQSVPQQVVRPVTSPAPVETPAVAPRASAPVRQTPASPAARPAPAPRPVPRAAPPAQTRPAIEPAAPVVEAPPETPPARTERQPAPALPMSAAAISELPFRIDLRGTQIIARQAGPDATIYTVRQRDTPLLMIYAGPQSEFPIFYGEQAVVGDRVTIVLAQDNRRIAAEHLFRREGKVPADIHVWLLATEGEGAALAEQIGQTIDPR